MSAHAGNLTVTVTASPAQSSPGHAVQVTVSGSDAGAHGVLAYQLDWGDGTGVHNPSPLMCTATVSPRAQAWSLSHTYDRPGTYTVSATVSAICTPDHATASVPVRVS